MPPRASIVAVTRPAAERLLQQGRVHVPTRPLAVDERRHAEDAARERRVGRLAQALLVGVARRIGGALDVAADLSRSAGDALTTAAQTSSFAFAIATACGAIAIRRLHDRLSRQRRRAEANRGHVAA